MQIYRRCIFIEYALDYHSQLPSNYFPGLTKLALTAQCFVENVRINSKWQHSFIQQTSKGKVFIVRQSYKKVLSQKDGNLMGTTCTSI
jgi:hypothetical protein